MFTIGIFTSHVPYILAFVLYFLFHFSGKPQLPNNFIDASYSQIIVKQNIDCKQTAELFQLKKSKSNTTVIHLRKLLSEKISARKNTACFSSIDMLFQPIYLTNFSFLRPPPSV